MIVTFVFNEMMGGGQGGVNTAGTSHRVRRVVTALGSHALKQSM
jgi:hypothetical protein